jgi:beta-lactamase regulating signal transducer with metallopeptidase domain
MPALEALLGLNALWQFEFLLGLLLRATAVLAVAWLADRLLRHASARRRVWLWTVTMAALLVQPFIPMRIGTLVVDTPAALITIDNPVSRPDGVRGNIAHGLAALGAVDVERHTTAAPSKGPGLLAWLFAIWAAVVLMRWTRLWRAGRRVLVLLAAGNAAPRRIVQMAYRLMPQAGRYVHVVTTDVATPFTFGWRHPVVSLPVAATEWSDDLLHSVLLHEFTHVRHGDWVRQVMATAVADLYWFHPMGRLGVARSILAAELRCDEQVLSHGVQARVYATHLVEVMENTTVPPLAAAACFAETRDVETRLRALLRSDRSAMPRSRRVAALLLIASIPFLSAFAPRLGSCEDTALPVQLEWPTK